MVLEYALGPSMLMQMARIKSYFFPYLCPRFPPSFSYGNFVPVKSYGGPNRQRGSFLLEAMVGSPY